MTNPLCWSLQELSTTGQPLWTVNCPQVIGLEETRRYLFLTLFVIVLCSLPLAQALPPRQNRDTQTGGQAREDPIQFDSLIPDTMPHLFGPGGGFRSLPRWVPIWCPCVFRLPQPHRLCMTRCPPQDRCLRVCTHFQRLIDLPFPLTAAFGDHYTIDHNAGLLGMALPPSDGAALAQPHLTRLCGCHGAKQ